MSNLQTLQQHLLQAVLVGSSPRPHELCADARASSAVRLAIYQNGYRIRLRDALATEYPGLAVLAGRRFNHLLESYVDAHPSGHYNIRWHGTGLSAFLDYSLPWRDRPELSEMAALDWAISTTFDAADEPAIGPAEMAGVPAEAWANLCLHPQSCLQMLETRHNVEAFRTAAGNDSARPRLRRYRKTRHLLVWRQDMSVRYRRIEADERAALLGAIRGESFATLCERLAGHHGPAGAMPRMATLLHRWLDGGLLARWSLH